MNITLVAYVPYNAVLGCVKALMEHYGEFYNSKVRSKMTAVYRNDFY